MSKHVLPTAPSPTTTHLIVCIAAWLYNTELNRVEMATASFRQRFSLSENGKICPKGKIWRTQLIWLFYFYRRLFISIPTNPYNYIPYKEESIFRTLLRTRDNNTCACIFIMVSANFVNAWMCAFIDTIVILLWYTSSHLSLLIQFSLWTLYNKVLKHV